MNNFCCHILKKAHGINQRVKGDPLGRQEEKHSVCVVNAEVSPRRHKTPVTAPVLESRFFRSEVTDGLNEFPLNNLLFNSVILNHEDAFHNTFPNFSFFLN